jgi:hypothetical protein
VIGRSTIDRHHAVMSAMGERFLLYRAPEVAGGALAERALSLDGDEGEMREEFARAVVGVFAAEPREPRELATDERERLIALVSFVFRARSPVDREGYKRPVTRAANVASA